MIIGLTGQSGAGKSTVASLLSDRGFRIIDCDGIVHALYGERRYARKIAEVFGEEYLAGDTVDRKKLGALVFSDTAALTRLNETVRPMILSAILAELQRARNDEAHAVLDAPLLFEYELENECDLTVGVITDTETAVARLARRDNKSENEIRARLRSQHGAEYFRQHCDFILENKGDPAVLQDRLHALLQAADLIPDGSPSAIS